MTNRLPDYWGSRWTILGFSTKPMDLTKHYTLRIIESIPPVASVAGKGRPWTAFLHFRRPMITNVYIDGFNFYYGCVKRTAFKWLDFGAFCRGSLPHDTINQIRYFTALVSANDDPDAPVRQTAYLRALRTVPRLVIHEGRFFRVKKKGKLIDPLIPGLDKVTIRTWEEKVSDVSIATHLVADGFRGDFEQAVVISNDSDLVEPIILVTNELKLPVHVLSPHKPPTRPSYHLQQVASSYNLVDRKLLGSCQFPSALPDIHGKIVRKPAAW